MYYKNTYIRLVIYILLLIAFSGLFFMQAFALSWYSALWFFGIAWAVYHILKLFNRIPQKISYFFNAVENEDSTLRFPVDINHAPTKEMNQSLNRVNSLIQEVKLQNREQEQYYSMLLELVVTGVVVLNSKGNILQANTSAKRLLNYTTLSHIEQLKRVDVNLFQAFYLLKEGSTHQFVKLKQANAIVQLSLRATTFISHQQTLRIISIHDISNELDANEVESWARLIRVLTHEIMNSITPITSLSETLLNYYTPPESPIDAKIVANTVRGLEVINERGAGLIRFVESYRKLTKLSKPVLETIELAQLIEHMLLLMESEPNFSRIQFDVQVPKKNCSIKADRAQISQVFINLIKNAIEAVEKVSEPKISIAASLMTDSRCEIKIIDNGPGVAPELLDQVFIPFFTTKENGYGIGLSLSRQIMKNHGGTIEITSLPGKTQFTLYI